MFRVELSNGYKIPIIGLGTWMSKNEELKQAVKDAIDIGYRHIDTAFFYQNESEIGEAIREKIEDGTIKREDLFVTSKCWNANHSKEKVIQGCNETLKALKLNYLDLYLVHSPMGFKENGEIFPRDANGHVLFSDVDYLETWMGMEECHKRGLVRSIGLSNFNIEQIKRVLEHAKVKPVMNQFEFHPYLIQAELLNFCQSLNIKVTSFSALGSPYMYGNAKGQKCLLEEPKIKEIASKYNKSTAQVLIRYQIDRDIIVIPKTVKKERLKSNFQVFDFKLNEEDMKAINGLNCNIRIFSFKDYSRHRYCPF